MTASIEPAETELLRQEWNSALNRQSRRLVKKKYATVRRQLDYDSFKIFLVDACEDYSDRKMAKCLTKLLPTMDHLNEFTHAMASFCQSSPGAVAFVWGTIQTVVLLASKFSRTLALIVEMLRDLTSTMTNVNSYLYLFPNTKALQEFAHLFADVYVDFCISTLKFLHKRQFYNLIRMLWSSVEQRFNNAKNNIDILVRKFAVERQYVVDETLVQGSRRIESLLVSQKPAAGLQERFHNVPYNRNPNFCGREDELRILSDSLLPTTQPKALQQKSCAVHAIGGMGKTQLAVEYTYRHRPSYHYILWLHSQAEAVLLRDLANLCRNLGFFDGERSQLGNRETELMYQWLESTDKNWLLIFDNAESWSLIQKYWPKSTIGSILVTTRNNDLSRVVHSEIDLKPFSTADSTRLLLLHHPEQFSKTSKTDAEAIHRDLGGHPLALAQAAGFLWNAGPTKVLLSLLRERQNSRLIFSSRDTTAIFQYDHTLATVRDLHLRDLSENALMLLQILSMLHPDGVPESMLRGHSEPIGDLSCLSCSNPLEYHTVVGDLRRRHLISRETVDGKMCLLMHRSFQRSILDCLDDNYDALQKIFHSAFSIVRKVFPRQSWGQFPQNHLWDIYKQYQPQVLRLCDVYMQSPKRPAPTIELAELLCDAANYFWECNLYRSGVYTSDAAEQICDLLQDHPNRRANVHAIAGCLRINQGLNARRAYHDRFIKAWILRQQHVNSLSVDTVSAEDLLVYSNTWNDIGCALLDDCQYSAALPFFALSFNIKRKLGTDIIHLENEKNFCLAQAGLGCFDEAIRMINEIISIMEEVENPGSASIQEFRIAQISILVSAGNFEAAYPVAQKVYDCRLALLGESCLGTHDIVYLLAVIEERRGNLERARQILERLIDRGKEWTRESMARATFRLGNLYAQMSENDQANSLLLRASTTRKEIIESSDSSPPSAANSDDEIGFDYLVSVVGGRTTLGTWVSKPDNSESVQYCTELSQRLTKSGDSILTADEMLPLLQLKDM